MIFDPGAGSGRCAAWSAPRIGRVDIRWLTAFLDFPAEQFGAEVTFWRAIAGSTVSPPRGAHREFASLEPFNGDPHLAVQRVDDGSGGVHLDVHVPDVPAAGQEAIALGATMIRDVDDYLIMGSPTGFVFCLVPWHGESVRSRPIRWPGDTKSIIDQICIDVPAARFDIELEFWTSVTGRPAVGLSDPNLTRIGREPRYALGVILQRTDDPPDSPTRAHLDLAATSVDHEVARHEDWGATVRERHPRWTVMSDPVGRLYCITDRNPRTGD